MSRITLSINDQILLLQQTATLLEERAKYLNKINFDETLLSYYRDLSGGIDDVLATACIHTLKTEEQLVEEEREITGDLEYIRQVRADYHASVL